MIEIRPAKWADLPELRRIAIETQLDTFAAANTVDDMDAFIEKAYNLPQIQTEWKEPNSLYAIAWEEDKAAGFLRLRRNPEVEDRLGTNCLELQRLYVVTAFQGKKVGAQLMKASIDYGKAHGFEWIWLGVWEHNLKAQDFYRRWGFTRFSQHVFQMGNDPQTDWLLKLKL